MAKKKRDLFNEMVEGTMAMRKHRETTKDLLFKVGDKVMHISRNKIATVLLADPIGRIYHIRHSGWTWAVPEGALRAELIEAVQELIADVS